MKTRVIQDEPAPTEPASAEDAAAAPRRPTDLPDEDVTTDSNTNGDQP